MGKNDEEEGKNIVEQNVMESKIVQKMLQVSSKLDKEKDVLKAVKLGAAVSCLSTAASLNDKTNITRLIRVAGKLSNV